MKMPLNGIGTTDYCLACIGAMAIRCAWCGKPITIGDRITLYVPDDKFTAPDHAVRGTGNNSDALVGCNRRTCADACDICGIWMPPGIVERIVSPVEQCVMACDAGTPSAVIVSNVRNYIESTSIHLLE
jgi:hypothetical protein